MLKSLVKRIIQTCRYLIASYDVEGQLSKHLFQQVSMVVETGIVVVISKETKIMVETLVETGTVEIMVRDITVNISESLGKAVTLGIIQVSYQQRGGSNM